ncbi:hypothetical protein A2U01_0117496, partial [Trifolium medium]|nr:hypothetical protein [Trifolium medium]
MGRKKTTIVLPPNAIKLKWVVPDILGVKPKYDTQESL